MTKREKLVGMVETLNKELETSKAFYASKFAQREVHVKNVKAEIAALFIENDITLAFDCDSNVDYDKTRTWRFSFATERPSSYNGMRFEFKIVDNILNFMRYSYPSNTGKDLDEMTAICNQYVRIANILKTETATLATLFDKMLIMPVIDETHRESYEIEKDIETAKRAIAEMDLDVRVGKKLYIATTCHKRYYGHGWALCTITKINKKSLQFVIHYNDERTSEVQAIPYEAGDLVQFQTIEQWNAEQARRNKPL